MSFQSSREALGWVLSNPDAPDAELLKHLSEITDARHAADVINEVPRLRGFSGLGKFRVERDRLRTLAGKGVGALAFIGFKEDAMSTEQVSDAVVEATLGALDLFHQPGGHQQLNHGNWAGQTSSRVGRRRAQARAKTTGGRRAREWLKRYGERIKAKAK